MFCHTQKIFLYLLISFHGPLSPTSASNILFFHTSATASHRTSIWPLAEKLADAGHNVTYMFPMSKRLGSHPRIEELKPSKMFAAVDSFAGNFDINVRLNNTQNQWLEAVFSKTVEFCDAFYSSPETHKWLSKPGLHYDLIMMDGGFGQCAYGLVYKFKAKHVLFNPVTMPFLWEPFGVVPESSSIPEIMFHRKPESLLESLWSRTLNTIAPFIWRFVFVDALRKMEAVARRKLDLDGMPSFEEIEQETSLVLHNTHFIEDYPMSLPPMFVSYSGLLCSKNEKKNPLPKNLESFIDDKNSEGFIYVSFGSSVVISAMPDYLRKQFMDAFAAFPNLKVLWRWTGPSPEDSPANVLFQDWFPQQDVLAHPKIRGFVSQAGRPSVQEALCFGVPLIVFPIFGDQDFNADRLAEIGAAIPLDITSVTTKDLVIAIKELTTSEKFRKQVNELSAMFRDRPMDPVENAVYWVEYVLKHNTSLLKPLARRQNWWQRRLIDVYALILFIVLGILLICLLLGKFIVKCVTRRCKNNNPVPRKQKKRKNM